MNNVTLDIYFVSSHTVLPPAAQKSPAHKAVSEVRASVTDLIFCLKAKVHNKIFYIYVNLSF
jgi:hypothetical protein